ALTSRSPVWNDTSPLTFISPVLTSRNSGRGFCMNRKWWKLIYLLPISLCTLYAGGYITQFIRNYNIWTAAGNSPGNGSSPQMPSPHPAACFQAITAFPYNLYGIGICVVVFGLL